MAMGGSRGLVEAPYFCHLLSRCVGAGDVPAPWQAKGGVFLVPRASGTLHALKLLWQLLASVLFAGTYRYWQQMKIRRPGIQLKAVTDTRG